MYPSLPFKVSKWSAWSPAFKENSDWINWEASSLDPLAISEVSAPGVSFLPAVMRKKLSDLCKLVLYLSHHTLAGRNDVRIVIASRYGESELMLELLESVARKESLSPMAFSRSVMNSSAGLFSIFSKNFQPSICVSAMEDSFRAGMFEALLQLYSYGEPVLFLYVEEKMPDLFKPYASEPPVSYGAGFLLENGEQLCSNQQTCLEFLQEVIRKQENE